MIQLFTTYFEIIMIALAVIGLGIATYLAEVKRKKARPMCPMKGSCDAVIHSSHATFLGVSVEKLGIVYYIFVLALHSILFFAPELHSDVLTLVAILSSSFALLFSFYLLTVQAFVLRSWCTWCVLSALTTLGIFILTVLSPYYDTVALLGAHRYLLVIAHLLGVILGVGAATISDILFFRFLKDYVISEEEEGTLTTLSEIVWIAIGILVLSGIGLYVVNVATLSVSGKFMVKMVAVGVLIINGFVLNRIISPALIRMSFIENDPQMSKGMKRLRTFSFVAGAVSITSWYFIFILGALRGKTFDFEGLLTLYTILLVLAIAGGLLFGPRMLGKTKA